MEPMNRRNFVALGAGATAATWMLNQAAAADAPAAAPAAKGPISHEQCIENCRKCEQICRETIQYCLSKGGAHVNAEHLSLMLSCAEICHTSAAFMTNKSEFSSQTCGVCAQVCQACADSCAKLPNDAQMQTCIVACKTCVKSCKQMAEGHHH